MSDYNLTDKQNAVYELLPDTRENIANELGISRRSVRYRMSAMEERGMDFERDSEGIWYVSGEGTDDEGNGRGEEKKSHECDSMESEREPWRVNSYDKAQATKNVNNELTKIEKEVKNALNSRTLTYTDFEETNGKSTLVIPRADDHFGVKVDGRSINAEYSTPIARERVNYIIDDAIEKARERGDVEDVILGLWGDFVDGEKVYPKQHVNLGEYLREQIREAATVYINQIEKLANEFEHVTVVTCPGNHGSLGDGVVSNADDIVYDEIELGIDLLGIDNVSFEHTPNSVFVEFDIRGWNGYARHGQDALKHASTSSGDDRWMNWKEESDFDVAYHGHHHELRMESVGHSQLFQCGTIVPPSLFVNQIGETGVPRAFYHFTTDDNLINGMEILNF
jgi:biotin operon repressor/cell fate (sporulation/competence/biofilm development) regulator YmcA (YheA/YmcA/DUF963 family)